MNIVLGIIITTVAAAVSASCLIGSIACMAAAQRKYLFDRERGCKVVVFPAGECSPIIEDPTCATDYGTGKFVMTKDEFSSEDNDDYLYRLNNTEGELNLK